MKPSNGQTTRNFFNAFCGIMNRPNNSPSRLARLARDVPTPVRVDVLKEIEPDDNWLEVPWASPTDPDLRYVDLKEFPERIGELEEGRKRPELARLLRKINSSASPFHSAKCDVWTTSELSEDERADFDFPFKVGSYVDLFLDREEFRTQFACHVRIGDGLAETLSNLRVQAQAEVIVRRCLYHPEERWGYSLTIFVHAYGADAPDALADWARVITALGDALEAAGLSLGDSS